MMRWTIDITIVSVPAIDLDMRRERAVRLRVGARHGPRSAFGSFGTARDAPAFLSPLRAVRQRTAARGFPSMPTRAPAHMPRGPLRLAIATASILRERRSATDGPVAHAHPPPPPSSRRRHRPGGHGRGEAGRSPGSTRTAATASSTEEDLVGGSAYDAHGKAVSDATMQKALAADAVHLRRGRRAEMGQACPTTCAPRRGCSGCARTSQLFANLRPAIVYPALADASSLKRELVEGLDILIVRELTGGVYFGEPKTITDLGNGQKRAIDTQVYDTYEIERIARVAFDLARTRRNKVTSMEKRNVMKSGVLWHEVVTAVHKREYPDVTLEHMLADAGGMQLVRAPKQFDVIVTDNLFGDMLSDVAAMLTGSLGMLPSASLGAPDAKTGKRQALYEPVHGSAPDIAGKGIANPIAMLASFAMALRYSFAHGRDRRPPRTGDRRGRSTGATAPPTSGREGTEKVGTTRWATHPRRARPTGGLNDATHLRARGFAGGSNISIGHPRRRGRLRRFRAVDARSAGGRRASTGDDVRRALRRRRRLRLLQLDVERLRATSSSALDSTMATGRAARHVVAPAGDRSADQPTRPARSATGASTSRSASASSAHFFIHVDLAGYPRPLRFEMRPGSRRRDGLRKLAPEAVEDFETNTRSAEAAANGAAQSAEHEVDEQLDVEHDDDRGDDRGDRASASAARRGRRACARRR